MEPAIMQSSHVTTKTITPTNNAPVGQFPPVPMTTQVIPGSASTRNSDVKLSGNSLIDKVAQTDIQEINKYLKIANLIGGSLLILCGIVATCTASGYGEFILAIYTIILGGTLIFFEFRDRFPLFDVVVKSNFGFLFTSFGRACFFLFISLLSFALGIFGIVVGALFLLLTAFNFLLIYRHPDYKEASMQQNNRSNIPTSPKQQQQTISISNRTSLPIQQVSGDNSV